MLERVALGQTRFLTPGLEADSRGVVLGRDGAVVFPSLEGVVRWLRLYTHEANFDEILPDTRLVQLATSLKSHAFLLTLPAGSSYLLDRVARCANLAGGATYTGSGKHFVRYRDDRAPYGYDLVEMEKLPLGAELFLHEPDASQAYTRERKVSLRALAFRLSLRRLPAVPGPLDSGPLMFLVAPGLQAAIVGYLWKQQVEAEVARIVYTQSGAFSATQDAQRYAFLIRTPGLPRRIFESFASLPGVTLFRSIGERVAVEVGYEHPFELGSCASLFAGDDLFFFHGASDLVRQVAGPVKFVSAKHLAKLDGDTLVDEHTAAEPRSARQQGLPQALQVRLKLTPSVAGARHVKGTLILWEEAPRLKQLVFILPPTMIRGHRASITERGILLIAEDGVDVIPLGTLLVEICEGVLVPLGMDLVPQVAPELLQETMGHGASRVTVFPAEGEPFFVERRSFSALQRKTLAKVEVASAPDQHDSMAAGSKEDSTLVNDPVGAFALWRFPRPAMK